MVKILCIYRSVWHFQCEVYFLPECTVGNCDECKDGDNVYEVH